MMEKPRKVGIRLELTERQKEQVREATGREVTLIELRLQPLQGSLQCPAGEKERTEEGVRDESSA
jgi:hypothetical protein